MEKTVKILRIPISKEAMDEIKLYYPTLEKLKALRQLLMQTVKVVTNNATAVTVNKKLPAKVEIAENMTRKAEIKNFPLSEIDLESYMKYLKDDPAWLPVGLTAEDVVYFEIQIRISTYKKMKIGAKILCARIEKFNESLKMTTEEEEKMNKEQTDAFAKASRIKKQDFFVCFEEFIYDQFYKPLIDNVMQAGDREIDTDFNELYPVETSKS